MTEIEIKSGGLVFSGWKEATIKRSIETIAGSFTLTVSDAWQKAKDWKLREGDACEIVVDGVTLITGYIDTRNVSISAKSHAITIAGRDAAGDLVDTSIRLDAWEFLKIKPAALLDEVAKAFSIKVLPAEGVTLPDSPIDKFSINPGETGFAVIDRIAKVLGALPVSDGKGSIKLMRPGLKRAPVTLEEGINIKSGVAVFDQKNLFNSYTVFGQQKGTAQNRKTANEIEGVAVDPNVKREVRAMVLQSENAITPAQATARAQWERDVRAARAERLTVTTPGWKAGGYLWTPGDLVSVKAQTLGVSGDMIIASVQASKGTDAAEETELELARPDAYKAEPEADRSWKE